MFLVCQCHNLCPNALSRGWTIHRLMVDPSIAISLMVIQIPFHRIKWYSVTMNWTIQSLEKCAIFFSFFLSHSIILVFTHHFDAIRFKNINQFFRFQVDNVRMIDRYNVKNPTIGTLYITATHIIFVDPETNKETWVSLRSNFHYSLGWQLKCI